MYLRFAVELVDIMAVLGAVFSKYHYLSADSMLKSQRLEPLEHLKPSLVTAVHLVKTELIIFLLLK